MSVMYFCTAWKHMRAFMILLISYILKYQLQIKNYVHR